MPNYNSSGVSEKELRTRLVQAIRELSIVGRNTAVYDDSTDLIDEAFELNQKGQTISPAKKDILVGNLREYLGKKVETRDAYIGARTLYELYRDLFPRGHFFDNSDLSDWIENPELKQAVNLNIMMSVLSDKVSKELESITNQRTP
ncbi:MAG: hypothetical protein AABX54_05070 [Nanoarchaeota archaeon]